MKHGSRKSNSYGAIITVARILGASFITGSLILASGLFWVGLFWLIYQLVLLVF